MRNELIREILGGNRQSLAQLFELDQESLYHFLLRRLGHREDAADATQESFRRAVASLENLRQPEAYRGWLYRIALNVAREMERDRQAQHRLARQEAVLESHQGKESGPVAGQEDLLDRLRTALAALEENHRTAVLLRYEQGLSYEEIAEATGVPAGTVAKRLHDAHGRLHKALAAAGASLGLGALGEALGAVPRTPLPQDLALALRNAALDSGPLRARAPRGRIMPLAAISALSGLMGLGIWVHREPSSILHSSEHRAGRTEVGKTSGRIKPLSGALEGKPPVGSEIGPSLAVVTGVVRDQVTHQPLSRVSVWIQEESGLPRLRFSDVTKSDGSFRIEAPPGPYTIDALAGGYVRHQLGQNIRISCHELEESAQRDWKLRLEGDKAQIRELELLRAQELRGLVVDSRGNPIPGARIQLGLQDFKWQSPKEGLRGEFSISYEPDGETDEYRTDLRGAFLIDYLYPDGPCGIEVSHPGFATLTERLLPSASRGELRLTLRKGLNLSGRVTGERGEAIANACLLAVESLEGSALRSDAPSSREDGSFALADLFPETRHLLALAPGYGPALVALEGKDTEHLSLVLPRAEGMTTGVILDEQGQSLQGVHVRVNHYDFIASGVQVRLVFWDDSGGASGEKSDGWQLGFLPQGQRPSQTKSQADGRFDLGGFCIGQNLSVGLVFTKEGYETENRTILDTRMLEVRMRPQAAK